MCVICCSAAGVRQPTIGELTDMYLANPHGAGYMSARSGAVEIHKGFMTIREFLENVMAEQFTAADPVVYHFRISTQAGVNPYMTHPFPLTRYIENTKLLDCRCMAGVAHNGIIRATSNGDPEYSDTALYIAEWLSHDVTGPEDLTQKYLTKLARDTGSKWVLLDGNGDMFTAGHFFDQDGLLVSNENHRKFYVRGWK